MKPTELGYERVKSPAAACARVEASSTERTGRRQSAASRRLIGHYNDCGLDLWRFDHAAGAAGPRITEQSIVQRELVLV